MSEQATTKSFMELKNDIIEVLQTVYDPEIPVDIYALGLIYEVEVTPNNEVQILMTLTSPSCPVAESLPQEVHDKVENIHHIHVWRLSDTEIHFECHADVDDNYSIHETDTIRQELSQMLRRNFNIQHITIQMEYHSCDDKSMIAKKRR